MDHTHHTYYLLTWQLSQAQQAAERIGQTKLAARINALWDQAYDLCLDYDAPTRPAENSSPGCPRTSADDPPRPLTPPRQ